MTDEEAVPRFLRSLANAYGHLAGLADRLRRVGHVREVVQRLDCRNLASGTTLDLYVDAELTDDNSLAWWLEVVESPDAWLLAADLRLTSKQTQDVIHRVRRHLPVRRDAIGAQLETAAAELAAVWPSSYLGSTP